MATSGVALRLRKNRSAAVKPITVTVQPLLWGSIALIAVLSGLTGYWLGKADEKSVADPDPVATYLAKHPDALDPAIANYLSKHPEVLTEMVASLLKKEGAKESAADPISPAAAITQNAKALFHSPHQVTLGNPDGKVTLVEFFDYNCGYCKRALPDMLALLNSDASLRVVLKEYPILGPDSIEAARVAIAVRMQDPGGQTYLAFHQKLLESHGSADAKVAKQVARDLGLDMQRLEIDMASQEVNVTLSENAKLADALNIGGTPSYVLGQFVLSGAVGVDALKERIALLR